MDFAPAATTSSAARIRAWVCHVLLTLGLHLVFMGVPDAISRWTTLPLYFTKVFFLTIVAFITGKPFVVRRPRRLPRFIGSPFHQTLRTYTPSSADINYICSRGGAGTRLFTPRRWKPTEDVFIELEEYIANHPSPIHPTEEVDFSGYQLVGPRLVQGQGICYVRIRPDPDVPKEDENTSPAGSYRLPTPERVPEERVREQRRQETAGAEPEDPSVPKNLREIRGRNK